MRGGMPGLAGPGWGYRQQRDRLKIAVVRAAHRALASNTGQRIARRTVESGKHALKVESGDIAVLHARPWGATATDRGVALVKKTPSRWRNTRASTARKIFHLTAQIPAENDCRAECADAHASLIHGSAPLPDRRSVGAIGDFQMGNNTNREGGNQNRQDGSSSNRQDGSQNRQQASGQNRQDESSQNRTQASGQNRQDEGSQSRKDSDQNR
jgi:hypothetical protein